METPVLPRGEDALASRRSLLMAAGFFGAAITVAVFDCTKAGRQSRRSWGRSRRANTYIIMLWVDIVTGVAVTVCTWLYLNRTIEPSIQFLVSIIFVWCVQMQCLMQILANRLCLIMYSPARQWWLRVSLLVAIGIINVSFFVIAIPGRLHVNDTFIRANHVWNPIERSLLAAIDLCLNGYFMWLVKSKLVACGLTHYNLVYKYNLVMVSFSMSLDIVLIGLMWLPDGAVYLQVQCLSMLIKLNIEMSMAELLGKVVKDSTKHRATLLATTAVSHPPSRVGVDLGDHQWLGSARSLLMPRTPCSCHILGGDGMGGQIHWLDGGTTAVGTVTPTLATSRRSGKATQEGENLERGWEYEGGWGDS